MNDDLYCTSALSSGLFGKRYRFTSGLIDRSSIDDFLKDIYDTPAMWTSSQTVPTSPTTSTVAPPPVIPERAVIERHKEVTAAEAAQIGILDYLLRHRLSYSSLDLDLDWLNENCTGLFCTWESSSLIAFELVEDEALFKLKFHAI